MFNAAVLGYGTVGSGVVQIINENADVISSRLHDTIKVKYVLDLREFDNDPVQKILVHDFNIIKDDPEVDIVVETMGGINPAYEFVKASLEAGKNVCTSNKALVAAHGPELLDIAEEHSVNFLFEASVGGGIPIIRPLKTSCAPEDILEIRGILNGTTNYILTKMTDEGLNFADVLKDAQLKGFAERNPEADIEGYDAARKIAILASLAYGRNVDFEDVYTEGITNISDTDIVYVKKLGGKIKLFGIAKKHEHGVTVSVVPMIIRPDDPLFNVDGVYNAILVRGNMLGDVMFYGQGAGKLPTASAVVSDVMEAAKHRHINIKTVWSHEKLGLEPFGDTFSRFFVRLKGGREVNEAKVAGLFKKIKTIDAGFPDEYAFITDQMKESDFKNAMLDMDNVTISKIRADI
ncbi:MAG: homoserine dehydrogenase [Lachnospiraceae bacterium]|jgi:homoserine dehydrogenase|nr:homoserine dehydrogenase [Lachnospiraceae bacterium]MEE3460809.1 homoserine dehydrogenase [Lachnospiraceae bacterium]